MTSPLGETSNVVTIEVGGITMTLDLHQMLTAIDPDGRWLGYDPDEDEQRYEPSSLAADRMTKVMRKEVKDLVSEKVSETIAAEVQGIVREHLQTGEIQRTDEFGHKRGPAKSLTEMIIEAATTGLNNPSGYNGPTPMQKMVSEAVGRAFTVELQEAVKDAKAAALLAVQNNAAAVIRETIERSARGL